VARRDEVMAGLSRAIAGLTREEVCRRCDAVGVPAGPILNVDEVLADPHVRARGMVEDYAHPLIGSFKGLRVPFRFTGFDDPAMTRPPLLGEHTDTVLQERLGLGSEALAGLRAQRAI
jgi:crotonobetainyl-CoA:carnitine CoA-transferase CaiB-like acyl-CoA transferase